jgi:hypothetical protein
MIRTTYVCVCVCVCVGWLDSIIVVTRPPHHLPCTPGVARRNYLCHRSSSNSYSYSSRSTPRTEEVGPRVVVSIHISLTSTSRLNEIDHTRGKKKEAKRLWKEIGPTGTYTLFLTLLNFRRFPTTVPNHGCQCSYR